MNQSNPQRFIVIGAVALAIVGTLISQVAGMKQVSVAPRGSSNVTSGASSGTTAGKAAQAAAPVSIVALRSIKKGAQITWQDVGTLNTASVLQSYPDFAKEAGKYTFKRNVNRLGVAKKNLQAGEPIYSKTVKFDKGVTGK